MHTIERQIFFAGFLVVFGNALPMLKTVSDLMVSNTSDKFGLVKYFKELELDKYCQSPPVLDVNSFKKLEINSPELCLCTVIYNITKELESNDIDKSVIEAAKIKTNNSNSKQNDTSLYQVWVDVAKISPSMKLLMNPLNNVTQWTKLCYGFEGLSSQCKFLNLEVSLLKSMHIPKESVQKTVVDPTENIKQPEIPSGISEEPNKFDNQPDISAIGSPNIDLDAQNMKNENNAEEHTEINENFDEVTNEDELDKHIDTKDIDAQDLSDSKFYSKSSNDYHIKGDDTIPHSETKLAHPIFIQKNNFANHEFGDVEDSHFLFYFGMMTILSMLFYLALYNKKKIIALLIEGRRSTNHRRRPNIASYSKVETTDEGSTVF